MGCAAAAQFCRAILLTSDPPTSLQSELDLTDDATLAELDEQARKDAEMKLELLNMQVQQALAAVKGGKK